MKESESMQKTTNCKARYISFYDDFNCLMGSCPATCCKGWLIPVDDETLKKYESLKGIDYLKFKLSLREKSGIKCFNTNLKECIFHSKDGLCSLQKKYGVGHLSEVCRIFPRTDYNLLDCSISGNLPCSTQFLELSCPEAARLFVRNIGRMEIITSEHCVSGEISTTNDDFEYYSFLLALCDSINETIADTGHSIHEIYAFLLNLGRKIQNLFVRNDSSEAVKIIRDHLADGSLFDFALNDSDAFNEYCLSAFLTDKIMTGGYYHRRVEGESELLYKLCRCYFTEFDKMKISDMDSLFENLTSEINVDPSISFTIDDFLRNHLWYTLSSSFAEIFEDYSFQNKFTMAMIRNHLLTVFLFLYSKHIAPLNEDRIVSVLYSFSRRGAGSDGLYADFVRLVNESIYKQPF